MLHSRPRSATPLWVVAAAVLAASMCSTTSAQPFFPCEVSEENCNELDGPLCGPENNQTMLDNLGPISPIPLIAIPGFEYALVIRAPCVLCQLVFSEVNLIVSSVDGPGFVDMTVRVAAVTSFLPGFIIGTLAPISPTQTENVSVSLTPSLITMTPNLVATLGVEQYIALIFTTSEPLLIFGPLSLAPPSTCVTCAQSFQTSVIAAPLWTPLLLWPAIRVVAYNECPPSATPSPSPSATVSPSETSTPTPTMTPTSSPSQTASPSVTATATATATASPSITATRTASPSPSSVPCVSDAPMVYFSNLDPAHPTLDGDALVRGAAGIPVAITFTPPCTECEIRVDELAIVMQAENDTSVSFAYKLCQYYTPFFVTCPTDFLHTPPVHVYQAPALYRLPLNITYEVPAGFSYDLKLFLMPSANVLWRLSAAAPATPRAGLSNATSFLVRPPCSDLVQVATSTSCSSSNGHDWSPLGVFPSMHLTGSIPCSRLPPGLDRAFVLDAALHPYDSTHVTNFCGSELEDVSTFRFIDTTVGSNIINLAALNTLPTFTYTVLFDRPCVDCPFTIRNFKIPLARLAAASVQASVLQVTGTDLENMEFTPIGAPVDLALTYGPSFFDVLAATGFAAPFSGAPGITGIAVTFSAPLLWHYGLPVTSISVDDKPALVLVPALGTDGGVVSIADSVTPSAYYLPGILLAGDITNSTCEEVTNGFNGLTLTNGANHNVSDPLLPGSNGFTPIPCFGTGSITVVDNTLTGRFLTASGTILTPHTPYLIAFELPCTSCNVHLTHLSLPLQRIDGSSLRLNLSLALLRRHEPVPPALLPSMEVIDPALVSLSTSWQLPAPLALYTFVLPESFTAVDRSSESLQYGLILSFSSHVLWRGGLSAPDELIVNPGFGLFEPPPPNAVNATHWPATLERPGVWLRSWAEPFWSCLAPSHTAAPSCIPLPAARVLDGVDQESLLPANIRALNAPGARALTQVFCSGGASASPHPGTSSGPGPAASVSALTAPSVSASPRVPSNAVTGYVYFDLLFDATLVLSTDFDALGPLTNPLRISISAALRILISFVDVHVVADARLLRDSRGMITDDASALIPAAAASVPERAVSDKRSLTNVHTAVIRVRIVIVVSTSLDASEVAAAIERMQSAISEVSVRELLTLFFESEEARVRDLDAGSVTLDPGSLNSGTGPSESFNAGTNTNNGLSVTQKGGIAGGVVGGVAFVALVAGLAVYTVRRARNRTVPTTSDAPAGSSVAAASAGTAAQVAAADGATARPGATSVASHTVSAV